MYTLIEPFAGSASLSIFLLGGRSSIVPYQGTKWRYRYALLEYLNQLGFKYSPSKIVLNDSGPWGRALEVVLRDKFRQQLIGQLTDFSKYDPLEIYKTLQNNNVSINKINFTAEFLFLQKLSFNGKAVGIKNGKWNSPGFNTTSAYGKKATNKFGKINPMIPSLIKVLEKYNFKKVDVEVSCGSVCDMEKDIDGPTMVYMDPPYDNLTSYPNGNISTEEVIKLAIDWYNAGAAVIVSEQKGLGLDGWNRKRIYPGRKDKSNFRGKQEEWITYKGEYNV